MCNSMQCNAMRPKRFARRLLIHKKCIAAAAAAAAGATMNEQIYDSKQKMFLMHADLYLSSNRVENSCKPRIEACVVCFRRAAMH